MLVLQAIDAERNGNVQTRALFEDTRDVGKDSFLNLTVRHDVNRFQLIVLVKGAGDFGKIFPRERFASSENQHTEVSAERLRDALDLMRLHLQFLSRTIVEFIRKKTVCAPHVADRRNQNIQEHGGKGPANRQICVPFQ
jgi:hypothetical protein